VSFQVLERAMTNDSMTEAVSLCSGGFSDNCSSGEEQSQRI
jgi:hypothetical protein